MRTMRIIVTGSRDWPSAEAVWMALDAEVDKIIGPERDRMGWRITVVQGGAPGADRFAAAWAKMRAEHGWPVVCESHPAHWSAEGRGAGIMRNLRMVQSGADLCLAFIKDNSRGATHCATAATSHGIETRIERL